MAQITGIIIDRDDPVTVYESAISIGEYPRKFYLHFMDSDIKDVFDRRYQEAKEQYRMKVEAQRYAEACKASIQIDRGVEDALGVNDANTDL